MKILLVAAKTGGHVYPASAVANLLIEKNHEVVLLGIHSDIEKNAYKNIKAEHLKLSMEGFRGVNFIKKLKVFFQIIFNTFKVLKIINKKKIDAMIGFGGFITIPAGIASLISLKPIFLHEQNAVLGSANKILSKFSKINFLGFPINNIKNSIYSGNPIRKSFINIKNSSKIDNSIIKIYITGGSQGSKYINQNLPQVFKNFHKNVSVRHQCGKNNLDTVRSAYSSLKIDVDIKEFYDSPEIQMLWSDFVITRAGALTLSEICTLKRGSIIIPLPDSIDNHQFENAKSIQTNGLGIIHEEKDSLEELKKKIISIIDKKIYQKWKKDTYEIHLNSTKIIVDKIIEFIERQ